MSQIWLIITRRTTLFTDDVKSQGRGGGGGGGGGGGVEREGGE